MMSYTIELLITTAVRMMSYKIELLITTAVRLLNLALFGTASKTS
jgi:hypothetical protein